MDESDEGGLASARGILQCLRMLCEEARGLGLARTAQAIGDAAATAQAEVAGFGLLAGRAPLSRLLN